MRRTEWLQETRKMRFEQAFEDRPWRRPIAVACVANAQLYEIAAAQSEHFGD